MNKPWVWLLGYHLVWLVCLWSWSHQQWVGVYGPSMVCVFFFRNRLSIQTYMGVGLLAFLTESFNGYLGILGPFSGGQAALLIPLWCLFGICLRTCQPILPQSWWVNTLLGSVGGPLTYYGVSLILHTPFEGAYWVYLGIVWGIVFPALIYVIQKQQGASAHA